MRFTKSGKVSSTFACVVMPMVAVIAACSSNNTGPNGGGGGGGSSSGPVEPASTGTGTGNGTGTGTGMATMTGSSSGNPVTGSSSSGAAVVAGSSSSGGGSSSGSGSSSSGGGTGSGSGSDAGTGSGSGAVSAGDAGAGGASLCATAMMAPISAAICDGFETTPSDFTVMATAPDTFVLDTTKFYRGSKSMKFTATNSAYIVETKTFSGTTKATNNAFWGRYFFFNNMTVAPMSHSVFGDMHGTDSSNAQADDFHFVGGSRGKLQAQIQFAADVYTDNMKTPAAADPPFPLAADGWQCWEWQIQADDSFDFYINGTEVMEMKIVAGKAAMSGSSFTPLPIISQLQLGWQYFGGSMNSGWVDEVAVGPNRIGCGN